MHVFITGDEWRHLFYRLFTPGIVELYLFSYCGNSERWCNSFFLLVNLLVKVNRSSFSFLKEKQRMNAARRCSALLNQLNVPPKTRLPAAGGRFPPRAAAALAAPPGTRLCHPGVVAGAVGVKVASGATNSGAAAAGRRQFTDSLTHWLTKRSKEEETLSVVVICGKLPHYCW